VGASLHTHLADDLYHPSNHHRALITRKFPRKPSSALGRPPSQGSTASLAQQNPGGSAPKRSYKAELWPNQTTPAAAHHRRCGKIVSRLPPAATPTRAPYRLQKTTPAWASSGVSPRGRKRPSCVRALYSVVSYRIGVLALLLLLGERRAEDPSCDCLAGAERSREHARARRFTPLRRARTRSRSFVGGGPEENTWCFPVEQLMLCWVCAPLQC
jgi:hypothetical protein